MPESVPKMTRPRGRPPAPEPMREFTVRIPTAYHDRLIQLANLRDESVSQTVRALLVFRLRDR